LWLSSTSPAWSVRVAIDRWLRIPESRLALRAYLFIAVLLLVVMAFQLALEH